MADLIPPNIRQHRSDLFNPPTMKEYPLAQFERLWPFMSNVWHSKGYDNTPASKLNYRLIYCYCVHHSDATRARQPTKGLRKRKGFNTRNCPARLKLVYYVKRRTVVVVPLAPHGDDHGIPELDKRKMSAGTKAVSDELMEEFDQNVKAVLAHIAADEMFAAVGANFVDLGRLRYRGKGSSGDIRPGFLRELGDSDVQSNDHDTIHEVPPSVDTVAAEKERRVQERLRAWQEKLRDQPIALVSYQLPDLEP